jgi:hypothetical protein
MSVVTPTILDFGRIVLNFISYSFTVCEAISTGVDITLLSLHFSIIIVGSFDFRASREVIPAEVRSPEILSINAT